MSPFDYLSVLISIVLGLSITQLLGGFAAMVRARGRTNFYWPVPVQMLAMFLITVQLWWTLFGLREIQHWTFAEFLVVLMQPVVLYLMTALITPDLRDDSHADLREMYFREARWFYGAGLAAVAASIAKSLVLWGSLPHPVDLAGHVAFSVTALAGIISRKDWVHKIIAPLFLGLYIIYIALLFVTLPH